MLAEVHKLLDVLERVNGGVGRDVVLRQAIDGLADRTTRISKRKTLARGLKWWAWQTSVALRQQDALWSAFLFWQSRLLAAGWRPWVEASRIHYLMRTACARLLHRRVARAFAAWRLEQWHALLAATVSKVSPVQTPRRPVASPLSAWPETPLNEPPESRERRCKPEKEPRRPPEGYWPSRSKRKAGGRVTAVSSPRAMKFR